MSVHALLDHPSRLRARSAAARRPPRKDAATTRASLIVDFLAICELDPAVEALRAPAPAAAFEVAGAAIQHIADFEIVRDGVATLVDVLTDADLAHHPLRAALLGGATAADGRAFTVETPASLRAEPRFTTVRLIRACRRTLVSAGDRVRILHHLDECGTARLVEAAGAAQTAADGVAAVLALACEGLVAVDISRPILPETPVRRRKLALSNPFEF